MQNQTMTEGISIKPSVNPITLPRPPYTTNAGGPFVEQLVSHGLAVAVGCVGNDGSRVGNVKPVRRAPAVGSGAWIGWPGHAMGVGDATSFPGNRENAVGAGIL